MKLKFEHDHTEWKGTAFQYLKGRNHNVRRLRIHVGHHNFLLVLVPRGVKITSFKP